MHFNLGATTVDLDKGVIAVSTLIPDDNTEVYKTVTGKTGVAYETASLKLHHTLEFTGARMSVVDDLYTFWNLVGGAKFSFTYRDKDDNDHTVIWVNNEFPLKQIGAFTGAGTINLEDV